MARYIKANHLVAEFLHVENDRNRVTDGNYLLWQADILAFGKLIDLPEILAQIGGLALMAHEAKEEQDGTVVRPLPVATDPRFIIEPEDGNDTETAEGTEADAENSNESNENSNESNEGGEESNAPESDTEDAQGDNNGEAEQDTAESENPAESPENDENNEPANED